MVSARTIAKVMTLYGVTHHLLFLIGLVFGAERLLVICFAPWAVWSLWEIGYSICTLYWPTQIVMRRVYVGLGCLAYLAVAPAGFLYPTQVIIWLWVAVNIAAQAHCLCSFFPPVWPSRSSRYADMPWSWAGLALFFFLNQLNLEAVHILLHPEKGVYQGVAIMLTTFGLTVAAGIITGLKIRR